MEGESITPSSDGNAPLGVDEGASRIADILSGKSATTTPEEPEEKREEAAEASAPEPEAAEPEASEPDDEEATTEAESEPVYRLPDGREVTAKQLAEWEKGNLRQADYTRKTQELAEIRKAAEARQAEAAQRAQAFEQQLEYAITVAEAYLPPRPDPSLLETDPIGFLQAEKAREAAENQLRGLYQAKQQHQAQQTAESMKAFEDMKTKEAEALLAAMPHLRDKARLETFQKDVLDALPHYGFKVDDLQSVYDHRVVRLLADAIAYRKLQAQKPKAVEKSATAAPVIPAGTRQSPAAKAESAVREAKARLRSTGRLEDGAAAIYQQLFKR